MSASIHLLTENLQSLAAAAREIRPLRAGRPVHPTALWRWSKFGVKTPSGPVILETVYFAGRIATSREAVQRFLHRVAEAKAGPHVSITAQELVRNTPKSSQSTAKATLDKIGI